MANSPPLPPEISQLIESFLAAKRTGQIVLDVKDGRVLGWRVQQLRSSKPARFGFA